MEVAMFNFLKRRFDPTIYKSPETTLVAVAFTGHGYVPNFEEARYFEIYAFENGRKKQKQMFSVNQEGIHTDDVIKQLARLKMDVVIARNYGPRSLHRLKSGGIRTCVFDGGPGAAIRAWKQQRLKDM